MTWDRILTSAPINKAAAVATGQSRSEWVPSVKILDHYPDMPPVHGPDYYAPHLNNPEFIDFRGQEFGRLKVIGVMIKEGDCHASWVCRCACGAFCTRSAKSLKVAARGGNTFVGMCGLCDYTRKLRMGVLRGQHGAGRGLGAAE